MSPLKAVSDVASQALSQLQERSTKERREGMSRYFTTSMDCIGVSVPDLRRIAIRVSQELREHPKRNCLEFARILNATNQMEARQLVYEVLSRHPDTMAGLSVSELESLGSGNDNWGSVDAFAGLLTGVLWQRGLLADGVIDRWARSSSVWWRRTAVASTIVLNHKSRGGTGDTNRTLGVVEIVKADRHPMITKAVSWSLRSLIPWDRDAVGRYLDENESVLAPLVKREVRNKLKTGLKNPRR